MRYTKIDELAKAQKELDNPYVSIQVAATCHDPGDIFVVDSDAPHATHWSVYLRTADGLAEWQKDFPIKGAPNMARTSATLYAAKLSQRHFIPLEKIV